MIYPPFSAGQIFEKVRKNVEIALKIHLILELLETNVDEMKRGVVHAK